MEFVRWAEGSEHGANENLQGEEGVVEDFEEDVLCMPGVDLGDNFGVEGGRMEDDVTGFNIGGGWGKVDADCQAVFD